jgi:putative transposase
MRRRSARAPSDIVRAWKGWTSRLLQAALNRSGRIWKDRYSDNIIRTTKELWSVIEYIHNNPVKAGLVAKATDYRWSSAREYAEGAPAERLVDKAFF